MKYSAVLLFAIGAFALPQDASVTSAPAAAAIPSGLSPAISCAMDCDAGDVNCQAACLGNARPNASQAIATNECAAKCDQGDGSTSDSIAYAKCVDSCINSLFPSSQTAFAPGAAGGAVASGSASGSAAAGASASATGSANPTATSGDSASASGTESGSGAGAASTGAADKASARIAGAGLAGLLAIFAL
ncbi:uncharacterized protein J4E88_008843 [Alternaria novae-zelandiae]|uniref:uncharacterized protein n=1 Tax=Alternaria metachromatica TaxID=283354 RepID=UPI0020C4A17A|nr:uncharacterized protein J4E83_008194 [Alternaria metachromatica]XP_049206885.1 uncharacterized protein J4E79_009942 [Alternaria viburni]XP_049222769.1 uncharacterized protein J4E78_004339 [Alternaria triticimaculans]XP_049228834.1 uncharacterized protein J4E87_009932 [Alternaria ethzedia]XP_049240206.1 uncharacterized protein J4E84_009460 [Alternaria hordeiaustralica]XP_049251688.1 uncharacterized protein J4E88_008843 [Alternaria novae-zelandiae]XP_051287081.1 uncharacterized protein J4E90